MLAFKGKPKSSQTKFNNDNFNYFIGSPFTNDTKNYPLLNSGNGVGQTFLKSSGISDISASSSYNNQAFYPSSIYGTDLENNTGIPLNIDNIYLNGNIKSKYPSNTFFPIPKDWIFADTWMQDINNVRYSGTVFTLKSMFKNKQKGNLIFFGNNTVKTFTGYSNFNNITQKPYEDPYNPDMIFLYGGGNVDKFGYYTYYDVNKEVSDDYLLFGGTIYDFGWWYRINQVGVNSLFYPQNDFIPSSNQKIPIWNLTSIVNSILNTNRYAYTMEGLGLINAVAPCVVEIGSYSSLKWGPQNNKFNNNTCAKGNVNIYIKAARTPSGVNNPDPSKSIWYIKSTTDDGTPKRAMYEAAFPPFYGCYEFSTGEIDKSPDLFYDKNGNLLNESSDKYFVIKENQFGICPQIPKLTLLIDNKDWYTSTFTCYIVKLFFFQNPPDHKPWWCFREAYEPVFIDFKEWFTKNDSFVQFAYLNDYDRTSGGNIKNLREILKDSKYDNLFTENNEAILIYPSSLLVYERYSDPVDSDSVYILQNSPTIILRNNFISSKNTTSELYVRLRPVEQFYSKYEFFNKKENDGRVRDDNSNYYNVINTPSLVSSSNNEDGRNNENWISFNNNKTNINGYTTYLATTAGPSKFNLI